MPYTLSELREGHCVPMSGESSLMGADDIDACLSMLEGWQRAGSEITCSFKFPGYYETVAFVNAVAWTAQKEDHHPEVTFGYKECTVRFTTHSVGGITENDLVCAAKINELLEG